MARVPLSSPSTAQEQAEFVESGALLLDVLRDKLGLTAAKNGCGQGTCGACTVMIDGEPQLSCLIPAQRVEGRVGRDAGRALRWPATCIRCSALSPTASPRSAASARRA